MAENWKKGDIALCIETGRISFGSDKEQPPLIKNREYIVFDVDICSCGEVSLDVGIGHNFTGGPFCMCGRGTANDGIWWCAARRFVKSRTNTATSEETVKEKVANLDLEFKKSLLLTSTQN
jgi:hypothetical protein